MNNAVQKMKIIFLITATLIAALHLSGCSKKEVMTADLFKEHALSMGLLLEDEPDFIPSGMVELVLVKNASDNAHAQFIVFEDAGKASSFFENKKQKIEEVEGSLSKTLSKKMMNYSTYSRSVNNTFHTVARVDNTLLLGLSADVASDEVKNLLEAIGYQ